LQIERNLLQAHLTRATPPLNFELAYYLLFLYSEPPKYTGVDIVELFKNYRTYPKYEFHLDWIISGLDLLFDYEILSKPSYLKTVSELFEDDKMNVGTKLKLERIVYENGLL
jgi:hypothetical protein